VYLPLYHPYDFSIAGEYIEPINYAFDYVPAPVISVAAVDINNDEIWELLLAVQGRPLRVIVKSKILCKLSSVVLGGAG